MRTDQRRVIDSGRFAKRVLMESRGLRPTLISRISVRSHGENSALRADSAYAARPEAAPADPSDDNPDRVRADRTG